MPSETQETNNGISEGTCHTHALEFFVVRGRCTTLYTAVKFSGTHQRLRAHTNGYGHTPRPYGHTESLQHTPTDCSVDRAHMARARDVDG